jgi:apolipoprotein N-acyltransferase
MGLQQLTKVTGGYLSGGRRRSYDVPRAPRMLPLVCYEVIFPGQAVPRGDRPEWVLNLTNDGWFGISSGPYQHFRQARVRMIEERHFGGGGSARPRDPVSAARSRRHP